MPNLNKDFIIKVRADIQQAIKQLHQVESSINGVGNAAGKPFPDPTRQLNAGLKKTKTQAADLKRELTGMLSLAIIYRGVKTAVDSIRKLQNSFRGLEAVANHAGIGIAQAWQVATKLSSDGLLTVADAAKALQNLISRGYNLSDAVQTLEHLKDAAAFNRAAHLSMSEAVVTATEGLKNENSILVDNAGVTKNVSVMWKEYADQVGKTVSELTKQEKIQAEVNGIQRETVAQAGNAAKAVGGIEGKLARYNKASKEFSESLGDSLLPALSDLAELGIAINNNWLKPGIALVKSYGAYLAATVKSIKDVAALDFSKVKGNYKLAGKMADEYFADAKKGALSVTKGIAEAEKARQTTLSRLHADLATVDMQINVKTFSRGLNPSNSETSAKLTKELAALKDKREQLNQKINETIRGHMDVGVAGKQSGDKQSKSQKELDKEIKATNKSLKEQISLYNKQVAAVNKAQARLDKFNSLVADARNTINGKGDKTPDIIDISKQTLDAENLAKKGDKQGAIDAASKAVEMIKQLKDAGGEADIVLQGLLKRAEKVGEGAATSAKDALMQTVKETIQIITDLRTKAEELQSLKVGFDADGAKANAASLRAALQADFTANPLILPVKVVKTGSAGTGDTTPIPAKAGGGLLRGPGTGTSDSILMYGSNGEYVIKADAVRKFGVQALEDINHMRRPRFADGGLVRRAPVPVPTASVMPQASGVPIHIHLNGKSYAVNAASDVADELRREVTLEAIKRGDGR